MKQLIVLFTITSLLSCTESFKSIDPKAFNKKIASRADIETPEELISVYYDYPANEGKPNMTINSKELSDKSFEITLIHNNLDDDSQSGEKIVMRAKLTGKTWTVIEIKKNWKCWDDRGQNSWGTSSCN